ncbi:hypothetical protein E2C01_011388 [Portunus trituberculatus]|uniref:Uncharacterized protein n=1 Tax=Portunus trituberculatus TaxID=210409 RepID=A0A5B7DB90_PORTR|nr:hypothetical protein [Portunus trituberculatus]
MFVGSHYIEPLGATRSGRRGRASVQHSLITDVYLHTCHSNTPLSDTPSLSDAPHESNGFRAHSGDMKPGGQVVCRV